MIKIDFDNICCGCSACIDVCPKKCIHQHINKNGFVVPRVDRESCIDCHLCEKVCPVLLPAETTKINRKLYSAYSKNAQIRVEGSSGSVFFQLASKYFQKGGVVFGAAFDEKFQLKHICAHNLKELKPLLKSKYLQSNTLGVFNQVKGFIRQGVDVLFVGTPCQCNALYKYLNPQQREHLLLVDFICHGVPSQKFFDKALGYYENKHNCKILDFKFRVKSQESLHGYSLKRIDNTNNDVIIEKGTYKKFPFYYAFKQYIGLRNSCYHCKFAVRERISDITLADFWHIDELEQSLSQSDINKGYSMVITNTPKGNFCFQEIHDVIFCKEYEPEYAVKYNFSYIHSPHKGIINDMFLLVYKYFSYSVAERIFLRYPQHIVLRVFKYLMRVLNLNKLL